MSTVLDTIAKLQRLAQNAAAAPGEVEAALGRIAHLMATHGITDDALRAHLSHDERGNVHVDWKAVDRRMIVAGGQRLNRWQAWTVGACSQVCGCRYYTSGANVWAYGLAADLAVLVELHRYAWERGEAAHKAWCKSVFTQRNSIEGRSWRDGYCKGLFDAAENARALLASSSEPLQLQCNASGGALVIVPAGALVAAKAGALTQYASQVLHLRSSRRSFSSSGRGDSNAYAAGRATGASTNLGNRGLK